MSGSEGWIEMWEAYTKLLQERTALADENAKLREEYETSESWWRDMRAASEKLGIPWGDGAPQCLALMVKEIERLRAELAALRAAPRKLVEWRNNTTPEAVPYRVEQQQPAEVTQGEWRSDFKPEQLGEERTH